MMTHFERALRGALGLVAASALCTGCASVQPEPIEPATPLAASVEDVANQLADAVRLRADVNAMRIYLHEVEEVNGVDGVGSLVQVSEELTEELTVALGSRFHVVDVELLGPPLFDGPKSPADVASHYDASHLVVATFAPHQNDLLVNVRLVDAETFFVVGVARGQVKVNGLSNRSRVALGDKSLPRHLHAAPPSYDPRRNNGTRTARATELRPVEDEEILAPLVILPSDSRTESLLQDGPTLAEEETAESEPLRPARSAPEARDERGPAALRLAAYDIELD